MSGDQSVPEIQVNSDDEKSISSALSQHISNSAGMEIGIKLNQENDIILVIMSNIMDYKKIHAGCFVFTKYDRESLRAFDIMLKCHMKYHRSYDGTMIASGQANTSAHSISAQVMNKEGHLISLTSNEEYVSITIVPTNVGDNDKIEYVFKKDETILMNKFSLLLTGIINNCNSIKLPVK